MITIMRMNRIYLYIVFLTSALISCSVCDGPNNEQMLKDVYFNAQNVNTESVHILSINAEGNNLEEVRDNSTLFAPPSKFGQLVYQKSNLDKIYLYNIKKQSLGVISEGNSSVFYKMPMITNDGKYIIASKNIYNIVIYSNAYDSVFTKIYEHPALDKEVFAYSIAPNSQNISYFELNDDKLCLNILNLSKLKIESSFLLNNDISVKKVFWSNDSKYIYYSINADDKNYLIKNEIRTGTQIKYNLDELTLNDICIINDKEIIASIQSGGIVKLNLNDKGIVSKVYLADFKQNEYCRYLSYNAKKDMLLFTKNTQEISQGNLYVYDVKSDKTNYLFSNTGAGYWVNLE